MSDDLPRMEIGERIPLTLKHVRMTGLKGPTRHDKTGCLFAINLDPEEAVKLKEDGWTVMNPDRPWLQVTAPYAMEPIIRTGFVDVEIFGIPWSFPNKSGIKAYLKSITPNKEG